MTTLWHRSMDLADEGGRKLVVLMDGSRDRDELAREMGSSRLVVDQALKVVERHALLTE